MTLIERRYLLFMLGLLFGVLTVVNAARANVPEFVHASIYGSNMAKVLKVETGLSADLVLLDGGLEQGLSRGMVCTVERDIQSISIGELIIIESQNDGSAALILDLTNNSTIQAGDSIRIKTL